MSQSKQSGHPKTQLQVTSLFKPSLHKKVRVVGILRTYFDLTIILTLKVGSATKKIYLESYKPYHNKAFPCKVFIVRRSLNTNQLKRGEATNMWHASGKWPVL